jgi:hypothetical protein
MDLKQGMAGAVVDFFSSPLRPDRFWGPTSLLSNVSLGFRRGRGKAAGA